MTIVEMLMKDRDDEGLSPEVRTVIDQIIQIVRNEMQFRELVVSLYAAHKLGDDWEEVLN